MSTASISWAFQPGGQACLLAVSERDQRGVLKTGAATLPKDFGDRLLEREPLDHRVKACSKRKEPRGQRLRHSMVVEHEPSGKSLDGQTG